MDFFDKSKKEEQKGKQNMPEEERNMMSGVPEGYKEMTEISRYCKYKLYAAHQREYDDDSSDYPCLELHRLKERARLSYGLRVLCGSADERVLFDAYDGNTVELTAALIYQTVAAEPNDKYIKLYLIPHDNNVTGFMETGGGCGVRRKLWRYDDIRFGDRWTWDLMEQTGVFTLK